EQIEVDATQVVAIHTKGLGPFVEWKRGQGAIVRANVDFTNQKLTERSLTCVKCPHGLQCFVDMRTMAAICESPHKRCPASCAALQGQSMTGMSTINSH
ncbi:hypothetical protein, partial [Pseudomonas viridiflava]|uniref:hypothetical protein n=1 Tax=Pseudomonas viridiflava TaxID=33069 RepID=UPI0019D104F6